jgi:GAF domain-containing protein
VPHADRPGASAESALPELVGVLLTTPSMRSLLDEMARLAARVIAPCADCGLTLRRDHRDRGPVTVASHGPLARLVDEERYGAGDGPCLHCMRSEEIVDVPDFAAETRWGPYRACALDHGVRSCLSLPLVVDGDGRGALSLYSGVAHAFDAGARLRAVDFAAHAATALTIAVRQCRQLELTQQLQTALTSRSVIDQAIGIIVGRDRCTVEQAFDLLRTTSQRHNRKLRDVAGDLVTATVGGPTRA